MIRSESETSETTGVPKFDSFRNKPSTRPIFFFFNETFLNFTYDMKCITYLGFSNYFKQKNCRLHSTRCAFEIKIEKKKRNKLKLDYAERAYK